jgi:hypothetical protein
MKTLFSGVLCLLLFGCSNGPSLPPDLCDAIAEYCQQVDSHNDDDNKMSHDLDKFKETLEEYREEIGEDEYLRISELAYKYFNDTLGYHLAHKDHAKALMTMGCP